ncbi:MAG: hypothetical protein Q8R88_10540 [Desulfoprunum sp.]|nr:hypothetical protein [Desulfoprunum sp.]
MKQELCYYYPPDAAIFGIFLHQWLERIIIAKANFYGTMVPVRERLRVILPD